MFFEGILFLAGSKGSLKGETPQPILGGLKTVRPLCSVSPNLPFQEL